MIDKTYMHGYDDYLCFFGSNPNDMADFNAEWELCMVEGWSEIRQAKSYGPA